MHRWLEACFGFKKKRDCTTCKAKTKVLICVFVFTYAKIGLSHDLAQICSAVFHQMYKPIRSTVYLFGKKKRMWGFCVCRCKKHLVAVAYW